MAKPSTGTDLDQNVKSFVTNGYNNLLNPDYNRTFWAASLGIMALGLVLSFIPFPPVMAVGIALMVLPLITYGLAWGVVGVTDLTNRICCAIVNKYHEWQSNRNKVGYEPWYERAKAKVSGCFKGNDNENSSSSCFGGREQYSRVHSGSHGSSSSHDENHSQATVSDHEDSSSEDPDAVGDNADVRRNTK